MLEKSAAIEGGPEVDIDLAAIRALATRVPGEFPVAVNGVKVAASIRPRKFVVAGGDDTPVIMPRTAFQVVYRDGAVMLDSGLDRKTHESFGGDEPYYPDQFDHLRRALEAARLIVLTHHHADHVAGVLCAPNVATLARKTIASLETIDLMMNSPHRPHLRIDGALAGLFIGLDYPKYYPVAPGLVLIKAPGHSSDMQMAFIRLSSGQEFLHSVDAAWSMQNILQKRGKAAPWVKEDVPAVMAQLRWLNRIHENETSIVILVTHDDERFDALAAAGIIGARLAM